MDYRTLGRSGCAVSNLCLGTMTFGAETDEAGSHAQLDRFVEAGGTLVDTADVYSAGVSEEIIGRWFADRPADVTERVVLATKGRFPMGDEPNGAGLSTRHLTRALDASLRRLGVDAVDLYQVHAFDPLDAAGGDAAHAGRLHPGRQDPLLRPVQLHRLAADQGRAPGRGAGPGRAGHPAAAVQPDRPRDRVGDRARRARTPGMGLLPWSPLGGGWLSGKYRRDQRPTGATRLGDNPERGMEAWDRRGTERTWDDRSTPCRRSPRPAASRWPRSPWPG